MHIEILTEDKSGSVVVERLTKQIVKSAGVSADIAVRPHKGCGNLPKDWNNKPPKFAGALLDLLPAKCRAYNKVYGGTDTILVVVMDSDDKDPVELRRELYTVCRMYCPSIKSVIGISTEEIEAWILADPKAILQAYPESDMEALKEYVPDSICGTWEMLCKVTFPKNYRSIIEIGYPAIGHYKSTWADSISEYMDASINTSPSFINYKNSLEAAFKSSSPMKGPGRSTHTRSF
ncbi:MAG: hypothetical protein MJ094_02790 [Saccharofermentans sp.]|nr:hypothetical protein [Saccharofermentans sp.]